MAIRAVVFDIGGVLELDAIGASVDIGLDARWEQRLVLEPGELDRRMEPVWRAGSLGECTEEDVHQEMGKRLAVQWHKVRQEVVLQRCFLPSNELLPNQLCLLYRDAM